MFLNVDANPGGGGGGGALRKNFDGGVWLRFSIGYPWLR